MNRKYVFIVIIIVVIIFIVVFLAKSKDYSETSIENEVAINDVKIDKVTFSNITQKYEDGITTLNAKMINNSSKTKNFTVNITLKDDEGKTVQSLTQVVENLETGRSKNLSVGIVGDYSYIKDIKFEVIDD